MVFEIDLAQGASIHQILDVEQSLSCKFHIFFVEHAILDLLLTLWWFKFRMKINNFFMNLYHWKSVAGSEIQAIWTVGFEDSFSIGNYLKAQNCLQMVCTIPGFLPGAVCILGFGWLLSIKPGTGTGNCIVKIDLEWGSRNVWFVPGCKTNT